jgi:putative ABC transport system permease protein
MIFKIIYRSLIHKPLNALLSLFLLMLSVAIISLLLVAGTQINNKLDKDLADVDMVVGAKGSPLQLVLSALYHIDAPTGNISKKEADKIAANPLVETAIPLSYGDSYKGYRIVGTIPAYVELYGGKLAIGSFFAKPFEVVLGAQVAQRTGLKIGDLFHGNHGEEEKGEEHEEFDYKVVGLLEKSGMVIDQLILTPTESVWDIHEEEEETSAIAGPMMPMVRKAKPSDDHTDLDHLDHNITTIETKEAPDKQITALLLKFKSPMAIMTLPRIINAETNMQAAVPTLEINRLMNMMGIGISALQAIAFAIMLIAGLSVFVALYNRLKERKFEHALMRSMGSSRSLIFWLLLSEGILLSLLGFILGLALCRGGLALLNKVSGKDFHFYFDFGIVPEEGWLFAITLFIGIFAAVIPAIKAYRLNIAQTLSDG